MQRSNPLLIAFGLAVVVSTVLWMWQRDEPRREERAAVTNTKRERTDEREWSRSESQRRDDPADHALQDEDEPSSSTLAAPRMPAPRLEDLPAEVRAARVEAFRVWHDAVHARLIRCMPPWTEQAELREVRVHFRPAEPSGAEGQLPRLEADEVEPLMPDAPVPDEVRRCLDQLRDITIELPEQAPEVEFGHQEIIQVMWG